MEWSLGVKWVSPPDDPITEGRRVWAWIQAIKPLHPSLALWRPTMNSPQQAEQAPPITQDLLLERIHIRQQQTHDIPGVSVTPAFSGQIGTGNKLIIFFDRPNPGINGIRFDIGQELGQALDTNEALVYSFLATSIHVLEPTMIAALTRMDHPLNPGREPYDYVPGWKMYFPTTSPHWQRAQQLATRVQPTTHGAILTYGTPDTYPAILDQWDSPQD